MKRFFAWAPWMVVACMSYAAQGRPASVDFGLFGVSPPKALRVGDECFVRADLLDLWGWSADRGADGQLVVQVQGNEVPLALHHIDGGDWISLSALAQRIDAGLSWRPKTDVAELTSRVRVVRVLDGHLSISASLPLKPKVTYLSKPERIAVEFVGATLEPDAVVDVLPGLQVSSPKPNDIQVVFPVKGPLQMDPGSQAASVEFDFDTTLLAKTGPGPAAQPLQETLNLDSETDSAINLSLPLPSQLSKQPEFQRVDATTLRVTLPGVNVLLSSDNAGSKDIKHVDAEQTAGGTNLTFQLSRPMGITVSAENGLHIQFVKPPVGDGQLAGKVIVVDPGHGGKDSGTKSLDDGFPEKNFTLPISKMLAADLAAQGATVIMTRQTDQFISLEERAAIANRNHANLFLCVHINSNGRDRRSSGTITFYHKADPVSSTLADCIEREIGKVSGIPMIGTWSDTKVYHSGFSVLRNTHMPAVLMELGFMDNHHDRSQLNKPEIQTAIAQAIVKGVQVYLGGSPAHEN